MKTSQKSAGAAMALATVVLAWAPAAGAAPAVPVTACPGSPVEVVSVPEAPLFSWSLLGGAAAYELVVLPIPRDGEEVVEPLIRKRFPGTVTSWAAPAQGVLLPGDAYAWYVRGLFAGGDGNEVAGDWSRGRLFRPSPAPLLAVIEPAPRRPAERTIVAATRAPAVASRAAATAADPAAAPTPAGPGAGRIASALLATAAAAVGATVSDTSGEASGIVGVTHSPDGAGIVAASLGVGVDLVLSGDPTDATDLGYLRSEVPGDLVLESGSGVEIEIADGRSLVVEDAGTPLLTVNLSGATAAAFAGDGGELTEVTAAGIACVGCVGGGSVSNSVTGADVEDGSLGGVDVFLLTDLDVGGLTGADISDGTITDTQLAAGSIGSAHLAANSVGSSEIATGAVGTAEIENGSLRGEDLGTIRVVMVECNGECTDSTLGQICALAPGSRPIGVTCDEVDPFSPGGTCGGDNQCLTLEVTASSVLEDYCADVGGVDALVFCLDD
jgi:hypothetical protein